MAILKPTSIYADVAYLGVTGADEGIRSAPVERVDLDWAGFRGESHSGLTRAACVRVRAQYPKGAEIRNTRQVSILGADELEDIAAAMGLARVAPEWLGANLVLRGAPALTTLPPSARLIFESGASLVVDMENAPCRFPADEIEREHPGAGKAFVAAATGRRGVTAWVERPGQITLGMRARLHAPPQRLYAHI